MHTRVAFFSSFVFLCWVKITNDFENNFGWKHPFFKLFSFSCWLLSYFTIKSPDRIAQIVKLQKAPFWSTPWRFFPFFYFGFVMFYRVNSALKKYSPKWISVSIFKKIETKAIILMHATLRWSAKFKFHSPLFLLGSSFKEGASKVIHNHTTRIFASLDNSDCRSTVTNP